MSRWVKDEDTGAYYYYYSNGEMATGWQKLDGEWYYFYDDGSMARDTMVKGYYVNDDGQWTKDERSRKITDNDGNDFWYYVGPKGKAVTGWNKIGDTFHYYNYPYGSMTWNNTIDGFHLDYYGNIISGTGWLKDEYSGNWYYFSDGKMTYNNTVDGYHLNSHGKMVTGTGWIAVDSWWYYIDDTGKVVTNWLYDQGNWYYLYPQGSMAKGWIQVNDEWYYLNSSGEMKTGWIKYGDSWYYFDKDGKMKTGWVQDNGYSYYLNDDGTMAHDTTIDGYYVSNDGKWRPNTVADEEYIGDNISSQVTNGAAVTVTYDGTEFPEDNFTVESVVKRVANGTVVRIFKDINEFFKYQLLMGMGETNGEEGVIYVTEEQEQLADAGADMLTTELGGDFIAIVANGVRAYKNIKTGEIIYNESYVAGSGAGNIAKGLGKTIREKMLESPSAKMWGTLEDGTNQGVKHFADYWERYPERIPSLAERLGVDASKFENTVEGFGNFTEQVLKVKNNGILREVNGKQIYYLEGAANPKKGVVVIFRDGKIQSMMPSDLKSFNKLQ